MNSNVRPLQLAVYQILATALTQVMTGTLPKGWSVQGMGMLRLYIADIGRLHIWDSQLRYPGVSMIHNHSWDLRSTVVAGCLVNTIYSEEPVGEEFLRRRLVTGYNCEFVEPAVPVHLVQWSRRAYLAGEVYAQNASEIHRTDAEDSTITIMERREDVNGEADVFWPAGTEWGTAKPRPATMAEIAQVTARAIENLTRVLRAG